MAGIAIRDLKNCLRIYYSCHEIGSPEIKELFGVGTGKACNLKKPVREEMIKRDVMSFNPHSVNTEIAFKVWGIDIDDIERRVKKLEKLGLYEEAAV